MTDGYPRQLRTIERDERQYQTLTWTFTAAQAATFKAWWTGNLVYGGAWFAAPEHWPTPEGLAVKVRRFITAPTWQYTGKGLWHVSIDCEVRGASLLPQMQGAGSGPWLFFNPGDGTEPICFDGSGAVTLGEPVAFSYGVGAVNDNGLGENENNVLGSGMMIPLYSENGQPEPGEYTWEPASGSEIEPVILAGIPEWVLPAWANANFRIELPAISPPSFEGWAGGVLTLYTGNNIVTGVSQVTIITFLPSAGYYPPVSVLYDTLA